MVKRTWEEQRKIGDAIVAMGSPYEEHEGQSLGRTSAHTQGTV
jgi:hypothetical protein